MACILVLWITIPLLTLSLSMVPLVVYFYMTHRLRGKVSHPYFGGISIGILCAAILAVYLILRSTGAEKLAAYGISIATTFGFVNAGFWSAVFYRKSRSRLACTLFPGRTIATTWFGGIPDKPE